jgi:DNA-binding NarL/FixJ family response regulator
MATTVCIVEDNKDIRLALEEIITMYDGYRLLGGFRNAEEALAGIPGLQPEVVLMDIDLGVGDNGITCVEKLKAEYPHILFMMCTVYEDDEKIFEALKAGASGYILKKTTPPQLIAAIQELKDGGAPMTSQIARKVVAAFQPKPVPGLTGTTTRMDSLSKREMEILQHLAKGLLYKEIAGALFISQETVRKHVYHIYEKLHVHNKVEAINRFFGRG